MKSQGVGRIVHVCSALFFIMCLIGNPLRAAEEPTPKEVLDKELPPGPVVEAEDNWMFIADFSAFYSFSDVSGSDSVNGFDIKGLVAPVYLIDDRTFLILMYDGQYYKRAEFYSDDTGFRQRSEFQAHTVNPMLRFDFGERNQYSLTPSVFHTLTYNKDAATEDWDDGLYNYRDWGGGVNFDWRGVYDDPGTLSLGAQYYHRKYPNYASLLSLTGLDDVIGGADTVRHEKDYEGIIGTIGYRWTAPVGFTWGTEYFLLHKKLDDMKVVNSDGTYTGEKQKDSFHSINIDLQYLFDIHGGLKVGLDLNGSMYDSNQNYWDERRPGTVALAPDINKFTADYYDYDSYRIRPNISYTLATIPLTAFASFAYQETEYDNRKARDNTGQYKSDTQKDKREESSIGMKYDLSDNWAIVAQYKYIEQRSNNDDERVYRYQYTENNFAVGVTFKY